jgi:hypothetical protein
MLRFTRLVPARLLSALALTVAAAACTQDAPTSLQSGRLPTPIASQTREVDLGTCTNLAVDEGFRVSAYLYATGTQNYMWNGTTWYFVGPTADLFANADFTGLVGIHYSGPTWLSESGSGVVGRLAASCPVDPSSVSWLLLSAVSSRGPGIFDGTKFIQRLHTVGGIAPTTPGTTYGEMARVPYTAHYVFYQAQ